jgi:predicted nucleic acid-binding protein
MLERLLDSVILIDHYGWKLPDAFQAALALHHHLKLCTRNTKDFDPKKHSFVEVPYRLKDNRPA